MHNSLSVFDLESGSSLASAIASMLGSPLANWEERHFEDGEHKARTLSSVRGQHAVLLQSLYSDEALSVNDRLVRLLFFVAALKDAGAAEVTVVVPYLAYARKDRKSKPRDPVTSRYLAQLFESVGSDRLLTIDVHNLAAYQNAFRIATEHLEARGLFVEHFAALLQGESCIISPDVGGVKRAETLRRSLGRRLGRELSSAFMEKWRSKGELGGERLVGDVAGQDVLIIDDLIASGATLARTIEAARCAGARRIYAAATHALWVGRANELLDHPALTSLVVTDTLPPIRLTNPALRQRVTQLSVAPLLAEAIRRIHQREPLTALWLDAEE